MNPVTHKEFFLAKLAGEDVPLPTPVTHEEMYLAKLCGMDVTPPIPASPDEMYLAKLCGMNVTLPPPVTRYQFILLQMIKTGRTSIVPVTHEERFWAAMNYYHSVTGNPVTFTARRAAPLRKLEVAIEAFQAGSGDPSPDNVRAIKGWPYTDTSIFTLFKTGKNLFVPQWLTKGGKYVNFHGSHTATDSDYFKRLRGIYLAAGNTYRIYVDPVLGSAASWGVYAMRTGSTSTINIKALASRTKLDTTYTPSYSGWYLFWLFAYAESTVTNINLDNLIFYIAEGSDAYDADNAAVGTRIAIENTTPPGTVYGGTLDVLTGALTVDKVKVTLTNSVSFNEVGTGSRVYFMLWASNSLFSGIRAKNNSTFISDKFTNVPSSTNAYNGWFTSDGSFQFYLDESITTGDAAKTWLGSNNVEIVYTLKDAQTYQLTPEEVSTLVGGNTIWSDAGQVTVEYRAN